MPDQLDMPSEVRNHLELKMIGKKIKDFTINKVLGSGNTAITYEVEDSNGLPWALKIVSKESYGCRSPFREIGRFKRILDKRYLVIPEDIGDWDSPYHNKYPFIWFKSRVVNGITLKKYIENNNNFSVRIEITRYLENIAIGLDVLKDAGFSHGDLHDRNIMREVIGEGGLAPEIRYVIIDLSEAHPIDAAQEGLQKDITNYGYHLKSFSTSINLRDDISRDDEIVLKAISHLPGLLDNLSSETLRFQSPCEIYNLFNKNLTSFNQPKQIQLITPFDSLSTEYISNDVLLATLCYTKMWWKDELEKNTNVILMGPRGCGKTMVFRRLRLKTKIAANKIEEINNDQYVGFFIPCESTFYLRFTDLSLVKIDKYKQSLLLFFNMSVLAEITSTLEITPYSLISQRQPIINIIVKLLKNEIGFLWDKLKFSQNVTCFKEITNYSETIMREICKEIANNSDFDFSSSFDFISRIVRTLKDEIPFLSERFFIIFLDDYTEERVPKALQDWFDPIICQRSSDLCFKISSHMFGSIYSYPRPLALDEGRNITIINLGSAYLKLNRRTREGKLLLEILNERFKHCDGFSGTIDEWLGHTVFPAGRTISQTLHDPKTRGSFHYHGIECLISLCTGDYSEMIRMVGEIFETAGIKKGDSVRKIPPSIQDRAIIKVSREYLGRIRHIRPDGQKLFDVVENFGQLSKNLLFDRALVKQGSLKNGVSRLDPYDMLTIYVDELTKAERSSIEIWERLQKASIMVDIGLAPSQRKVLSDRVTLRRIYCPAFKTTLTSSEKLQFTKKQFEWFIDKPNEFCKDYFERVKKNTQEDKLPLWNDVSIKSTDMNDSNKEIYFKSNLPDDKDNTDFKSLNNKEFKSFIDTLPNVELANNTIQNNTEYDIFIAALGFEERTSSSVETLVTKNVKVKHAILLEFDLYYKETEQRREKYQSLLFQLTNGIPYRPMNAPVSDPFSNFSKRLEDLISTIVLHDNPKNILFDCTSCPSSIHSQIMNILLKINCNLTLLYTEAEEYYPMKSEWDAGVIEPRGKKIEGPFEGFRFVIKPETLQKFDSAERPLLLVLFPTFNTERTDGVIKTIDPAERVWIFGKPRDLIKNSYRIDMAKLFASPIIYPGDKWSLVSTFDYKESILALAGIYKKFRQNYRILTLPHGSKMQILGVNIFSYIHQVTLIFAMPKSYSANRYSIGSKNVWCIKFDNTKKLIAGFKQNRIIGDI